MVPAYRKAYSVTVEEKQEIDTFVNMVKYLPDHHLRSAFIRAFNIKYIDVGFNAKSKTKYYTFEKSEKLDKVIELYNRVKHTV